MTKSSKQPAKTKRPKKPSAEQIAKLKYLIDLCTEHILRNPVRQQTKDGKRVCIEITWPVVNGKPSRVGWEESMPRGKYQEKSTGSSIKVRYDCVKLLAWFKEHRYTTYNASDLYEQRKWLLFDAWWFERRIEMLGEISLDLVKI